MKPDTWDEQQGCWCECVGDENAERDAKGMTPRWRPSIHMPRWASRIALEVTGVRVETLNMITAGDAEAEGVDASTCGNIVAYQRLWDSINAKRGYGWEKNPWVWVVEFKMV
jgi:hypothetical protein